MCPFSREISSVLRQTLQGEPANSRTTFGYSRIISVGGGWLIITPFYYSVLVIFYPVCDVTLWSSNWIPQWRIITYVPIFKWYFFGKKVVIKGCVAKLYCWRYRKGELKFMVGFIIKFYFISLFGGFCVSPKLYNGLPGGLAHTL